MRLNRRYLDVLWGPIVRDERKKEELSERSEFYSFSERELLWVTKHRQSKDLVAIIRLAKLELISVRTRVIKV